MHLVSQVMVTDVTPDGKSMLVQSGIIRMRWRNGPLAPAPLTPGAVYNVSINVVRALRAPTISYDVFCIPDAP